MALSCLGVVAVAAFAIGCADTTAPRIRTTEDIRVITAADHMRIDNIGTESFFYTVRDTWLEPRALFPPFSTAYPTLPPGESASIAYSDLFRHRTDSQSDSTANVYWWYARDALPDGIVPFEKVRRMAASVQ